MLTRRLNPRKIQSEPPRLLSPRLTPRPSDRSNPPFTTTVYSVRAATASGAVHDLLIFARRDEAERYASTFRPLPLGFDSVSVVEHQISGATVDVEWGQ
jgi:hypothetical protein